MIIKSNSSSFGQLKELWGKLSKRRKKQFCLLFLITILTGFAESLSVGAALPFITVLANPNNLFEKDLIKSIARLFNITAANDIILPIVILLVLAAIFAGLCRILNIYLNCKFTAAVMTDLSKEAYKRTILQPYDRIISQNTSYLISTIITETKETQKVIVFVLQFLTAIIVSLWVISALLFINTKITLICMLVFFISYSFISFKVKNKLIINSKEITKTNKKQIRLLQEGFGGIRDIILESSQELFVGNYKNSEFSLRIKEAEVRFLSSFPKYLMEALSLIILTLLSYYLYLTENNVGEVLPIIGVIAVGAQRVIPSIQQIYANWAGIKSKKSSVQAVLNMLNQPINFEDCSDNKEDLFKKNKSVRDGSYPLIRIKNLVFKYSNNQKSVLNISDLTINKGENIGIIGTTGSGKSTLIDLIMGLIKPIKGELLINGKNINNANNLNLLKQWQKSISHVPQFIYLTDTTIRENIAFAIPLDAINFKKVILATKLSLLENFIENFPKKFDTIVGERGIKLSGGQRQRIGIARALYKDNNILILDEATSAVDNKTESKIIESINNLKGKKTIFMIAHRLTTLRNCDRIIQLENGSIRKIFSNEEFKNYIKYSSLD